jgi:hypothetical protein
MVTIQVNTIGNNNASGAPQRRAFPMRAAVLAKDGYTRALCLGRDRAFPIQSGRYDGHRPAPAWVILTR